MTLVVVDADVLGRQRTGDETYVRNVLRELPAAAGAADVRLAAVTRHPELVPEGVEAVVLRTSAQELRMAWTLPRLLRRLGADLVHTQYAIPVRCPCPAVVTIHDLSFERSPHLMSRRDRLVFRTVVPRAARRAAHVLTVSERTRADLEELYGLAPERITVTPNGVDPVFTPHGEAAPGRYVLAVGAVQERKNPLAALAAARAAGIDLVVVGPTRDPAVADELGAGGARLEGYVEDERLAALCRGAVCLVQASHFEGFGLPVIEAMACGTPVVAVDEPAVREVAGGAAILVGGAEGLADAIGRAQVERGHWSRLGIERARAFSWSATAERTLDVYREVLSR